MQGAPDNRESKSRSRVIRERVVCGSYRRVGRHSGRLWLSLFEFPTVGDHFMVERSVWVDRVCFSLVYFPLVGDLSTVQRFVCSSCRR